ncbi:hypothetical protein, partial [Alkalilimnicola ehrlichii]
MQLQINGGRAHPELRTPVAGQGLQPVMTAPVEDAAFASATAPAERQLLLARIALGKLLETRPPEPTDVRTRVQVLLPPEASSRGRQLTQEAVWETLVEAFPATAAYAWGFTRTATGGVQALIDCLAPEAEEENWQQLILLGADSLLDARTVLALAQANRIMTAGAGQGIVPGEAAGAVALTRTPGAQPVRA